ncbi:MAG: hypothetical protein WC989_03520 [Micavibrio sp.]
MKINMFTKYSKASLLVCSALTGILFLSASPAFAQIDMQKRPSLVITSEKSPQGSTSGSIMTPEPSPYTSRSVRIPATPGPYAAGSRAPMEISAAQVSGSSYYQPTQTIVATKVNELRSDLGGLKERVSGLSSQLRGLQDRSRSMSAEYNASVATINTQLQVGTTPGNPRLVERLNVAQGNLDRMSQNVTDLNTMAVEAANAASMGSYILEACRSAYGLSGAVEEDHEALAQLEDEVNATIVTVDRVLNDVNDAITRTAAYLSSERNNLRTLAFAVTNGDYYGRSLASRPFSSAPPTTIGSAYNGGGAYQPVSYSASASGMGMTPGPAPVAAPLSGPKPLVKIRFDKPNVNYEQAVYMAVSEAMQTYPNARLELIAVNPSVGNAAQVAIESTRARRNAEAVLRSLSQMGVDVGKIDLSTQESAEARSNEVHIFIR